MNPAGQPAEGVPLQGRYESYPAQPGVTTAVQHTIVNISAEPPKDYVVWSFFNLVHCNPFCLGLAALVFSIKARDRRMAGDLDGARSYASSARSYNIFASALGFILILVLIILYSKMIQAVSSYPSYQGNPYYRGYK